MSNSTTEGPMWDQSQEAKQFPKISVSPSFLLTVNPPIAPVKPCSVSLAASPLPPVYSISHALWAGFQSCTQPNLSPQPHSCGRIAALLLIPHPLTPHLHFCLLVSCSPHYASLQQDLSFLLSSVSPATSSALYLSYFLSHLSISNQKQNSCGISEYAWTFAYKGSSSLTLFCGYFCMCNTSISLPYPILLWRLTLSQKSVWKYPGQNSRFTLTWR